MRVRLIWNDGQPDADLLFRGIPQKALWAPFSFSACMQALVVGLGVSYLHFLAMLPPDAALEIRRDRVLDLSSDPTEPRPLTAPNLAAAVDHAAPQPARAQAAVGPRATLTAPALPAQEFRLPPVHAPKPVQQTLVQMDLPPTMDLHQQLRVPTIVLLASTQRKVARPFVAPPHRQKTMEVPNHVALEMRTPVLDVRAGYAKTPEVLKDLTPRLAAPVGAVAPVASNREPVEPKPAAATVTGSGATEPSNIISLPDRPIPAASAIVLPPLNQVSSREGAAAGTGGSGESAAPSNAQKAGTSGNGGVAATTAASGPSGAHTAAATGAGAVPANRGPAGGAVASNGTGNAAVPESAAVPPGPTRLIRPATGSYEVAIVQSSGVVPGSRGLLKGKPVYSVYIPVGSGKEWILQYCLPEDDARPAARSQVVQLGAITPITAPYAFSIIGPAIQFREGARYAFIHGFVNASGRFEHLEEASDREIENIAAVLESLGQWEFRPATKDGVPAVVEILLCIPNAA
ncbi:MAG TPA: hypothetical protein VKT81_05920 [Bryobacteraceae bacterium]|nr:hypothetical protein [Bryobacteraceae bacterium]